LGNVGARVVSALTDRGVAVRVADISAAALAERFPECDRAVLDFTDPSTYSAVVDGADRLFLIRPPAISRVSNTINPFIDAAQDGGVERIVFSSVAGAESNRLVPHHRIESHLTASKMAWTMLRPGFFDQNIATAYRQDIVEDDRIYVPAGDGLVAFIDARDIGEVAAACLCENGHEMRGYHLTGPEAVGFKHVAALLSDELGRTITYDHASIVGYFRRLRGQGLVLPHALVQTILHTGLRRGDAAEVTSTVQDLLGRPARPLSEYIADHRDVWKPASP
jgi:uncharacterized protein YbjT (DUF2867 family)